MFSEYIRPIFTNLSLGNLLCRFPENAPKINEEQKKALRYRVSAITTVKASMSQCNVRTTGAFAPGGLHARLCRAF